MTKAPELEYVLHRRCCAEAPAWSWCQRVKHAAGSERQTPKCGAPKDTKKRRCGSVTMSPILAPPAVQPLTARNVPGAHGSRGLRPAAARWGAGQGAGWDRSTTGSRQRTTQRAGWRVSARARSRAQRGRAHGEAPWLASVHNLHLAASVHHLHLAASVHHLHLAASVAVQGRAGMPRRGPKRAGSRPPRRQGWENQRRAGVTKERERAVAEAEEREVGVDLRPRAALVPGRDAWR
jgi:hypothetical protein